MGHRTKVKDLSKVTQLVSYHLHNAIEEEIVWPNYKVLTLPMVPTSFSE